MMENGMRCPECGRPGFVTETGGESKETDRFDDFAVVCETCELRSLDSGDALLRLLTRLANCGLTADSPTVLHTADT